MKSHMMAAVVGSAMMLTAPVLSNTAAAQPMQSGSGSYVVPVVVGAAAGATVGALLWPVIVPAGAVAAAPAAAGAAVAVAPEAAGWGWGAFMTTRALVGAVIGGGLGYISAR